MDVATAELACDYAGPVGRLLSIGEATWARPSEWPDYLSLYGLGPEHVDELIRMACDATLNQLEAGVGDAWAPVHAWRALGQLRAEAAVVPLLTLAASLDCDAADADIPRVCGMVGPAAIAPIIAGLFDAVPGGPMHTGIDPSTAIAGLQEIAEQHPDTRAEVVDILTRLIGPERTTDQVAAGLAICSLIHLKAVEAIDAIRAAFRRDAVDISIPGDEEDVEIALGLRDHRVTPRPRYLSLPPSWNSTLDAAFPMPPAQIPLRVEKIGRNAPCPCGSGSKYKKCCLP